MSSHGTLQNPPMKPAIATTKIKIPRMMTGHWRILTQELSASVASHIPVPIIGMDRSIDTKLMAPMTLLLSAILRKKEFCGDFQDWFCWMRDVSEDSDT